MSEEKHEWRRVIPGGIFGGIVGAAAMVAYVVVAKVLNGHDAWVGLKTAAAPFIGPRALVPGIDASALVMAFAIHVAVSIAWGLVFATAFERAPRHVTALAGPIFGLVVWIVMFYLVLPIFALGKLARGMPATPSMFGHALFGLGVAAGYMPFQRPAKPQVAQYPPRWQVPTTRHRPLS
jgi:hypothetical protein